MEMSLRMIQQVVISQIHQTRPAVISGNACSFLPLSEVLQGYKTFSRWILATFASKDDSPWLTLANKTRPNMGKYFINEKHWADVNEGGYDSLFGLQPLPEPKSVSSPVLDSKFYVELRSNHSKSGLLCRIGNFWRFCRKWRHCHVSMVSLYEKLIL